MKTKINLLLIISILFTFSNFALSQNDTINKLDKQNRKQGYWTKTYPNGKKAYEGRFKDDKPIGELKRYREDGTLKVLLCYNTNSSYSKATFYTSDGKTVAQGYFADKNKDSLWLYYNSNSTLVYEERYKNGVKHGRYKQYYPNGSTYETIVYSNGKMHGTMVQFHPNGLNKTLVNFTNGIQNGTIKLYYNDGKIRVEGTYSDGLKDGEWKFYSTNGKLANKIKYSKGVPDNYNQLTEQENKELELMFRNAGRIQEPTVESFLETMGARPY